MGCCTALLWPLVKFSIFCVVLTFIPGIPPHASYKEINVKKPQNLDPHLVNNRYLDGAEHLFEGEIIGPEAFAVYDGSLYTGVHGGYVMRVDKDALTPIVKFGKQCGDVTEEHICGRPLGMKFDKMGNLYVADAYYGIFKYNLKKAESTLLVSSNEEIEGKKSAFINDVVVASDGVVYFTVSSTMFPLYDGLYTLFAPGYGRLIKYDPQSGKSSVLAEDILLPNGVAISPNEDYLVISDTIGLRVLKYNLKGPKKNTLETFVEGLPGMPDNIRSDGGDGFYVSLVVTGDETHPILPQVIAGFPNIRRFFSRVMYLLELPFVEMNKVYPNYFCQKAAHLIGHFSTSRSILSHEVTILRLDSKGDIQEALIGKDGSVSHVSDIVIFENDILLGSPYNDFIGRVRNPNAPPRVHIKSVRYEDASPKETTKSARKDNEEAQSQVKRAAEEEKKKKAAEEAKARKGAEEAARKAEEKAKARELAEEAARKVEEQAKAKKIAEEAAKKAEEQAKARKAAEEAKAKKAEEEAALKAAEEAKARKAAAEAARRQEEARARKAAEEARKKAEEDARKAAEQARLKREAEEAKARKAAEEMKKKMSTEETERRKAAEEASSKKTGSN